MKSVKIQVTISAKTAEILESLVKEMGLKKSTLIELAIRELDVKKTVTKQ